MGLFDSGGGGGPAGMAMGVVGGLFGVFGAIQEGEKQAQAANDEKYHRFLEATEVMSLP